jgi:hypothetical protein
MISIILTHQGGSCLGIGPDPVAEFPRSPSARADPTPSGTTTVMSVDPKIFEPRLGVDDVIEFPTEIG